MIKNLSLRQYLFLALIVILFAVVAAEINYSLNKLGLAKFIAVSGAFVFWFTWIRFSREK